MLTPTSSQTSMSSRNNSLQTMLSELSSKIFQISQLKQLIDENLHAQQVYCLQSNRMAEKQSVMKNTKIVKDVSILLKQLQKKLPSSSISQILNKFWYKNKQYTMQIVNHYQIQIKKCRDYYQQQIWQLREQIKRQYKVIGLMKQEVQDLMILMKFKQSQNENQNNLAQRQLYNQSSYIQQNQNQARDRSHLEQNNEFYQRNSRTTGNNLKINEIGSRQLQGDLQIIEQQTQRTLQSSQRSQKNNNDQPQVPSNFIRIQQQTQNSAIKQDQISQKSLNQNISHQKYKQPKKQCEQFAQEITPKHSDRALRSQLQNCELQTVKSKNQSIKLSSNSNNNTNNNRIYYHSESAELTKDDNYVREKKKTNKLYTAPSDNRKSDHLQSIFFLDDQPEEDLNKTSKLNNLGDKLHLFQYCHENNASMKSLQHSQLPQNQQQEYSLFDYESSKKSVSIHSKTAQVCVSQDQSEKQQESKQSYSFLKKQVKQSATCRYINKQETSQYVLKKFNKCIPICQFQASSSVPVSNSNNALQQLNKNMDYHKGDRKSIENKPKTKQFIEQFRKTFDKCLKSMQVSKKNSTKIINSSSKNSLKSNNSFNSQCDTSSAHSNISCGVMTFGKNNPSPNYSSNSQKQPQYIHTRQKENNHTKQKQRIKQYQQSKQDNSNNNNGKYNSATVKAVDHMLKQLENNNKFVIGSKKLQLKYQGDKKNGIRSGNGILYYSNGLCYEGQFKDGVRHGYGVLKFNHIQIYNGDWLNDQIQGEGKIRNCAIINKRKTIYSTQTPLGKWISYSGQFKNSKFQGSGTLYLQGGQKFVGYFQNGYACGQGSIYKKNGEVQTSFWKNNFSNCNNKQRIVS